MSSTAQPKFRGQTLGVSVFVVTLGIAALSGIGPRFASTEKFLPHGYCYLWEPALVRLHVVSDGLIALAYIAIPITLVRFIRQRDDLPFNWMFLLFGLFIVACGATHLMEIWTLWWPSYWAAGAVKAVTAAASVPTAILLYMLVPQAVALPSTRQLREAKEALEREITERQRVENALREAQANLELRVSERTTELQRANDALETQRQELEASDRKKSEFLAILSHELRNPVHAIHTSTEFLTLKVADREAQDACRAIGRQVDQLGQLLDDLLGVVKGQYQLDHLDKSAIDLRAVVSSSVEAVSAAARARNQPIRYEEPPAGIAVAGDFRRLSQALVNILRNASNYSEAGASIIVELKREAAAAVIRIRDRGIGLDPSEAPRLFDLFMRGERAKRAATSGLGIGLHVAKQIVLAHGGSITAASEGVGHGTEFEITLPLSA